MLHHTLSVPTRSIRWLLLPVGLLTIYATWAHVQEHSYWMASFQFLMLAFLPFVFKLLNRLPVAVKFDENNLYIDWGSYEDLIPLSHVESITSTFFRLNNQSVFQICYADAEKRKRIYVLGGPVLGTLDKLWQTQRYLNYK